MEIDLTKHLEDNVIVRKQYRFSMGTKEQCKKLFIDAFKLTDLTMDKFEYLPEYDKIIDWMSDNKGKGLFMTGNVGRGKSSILGGVIPLLFRAVLGKVIRPISADDLHKIKKDELKWCVCIDEIGKEGVKVDYGDRIDAVDIAIGHCEDRIKLLIMTSNLNSDGILERYDLRILDRIKRLCNIVEFKGKSKR